MRTLSFILIAAFWSFMFLVLAQAGQYNQTKASNEIDEKHIMLALFTHLLRTENEQPPARKRQDDKAALPESSQEESSLERFTVYYLAINHRKDPSDEILKHFARNKPSVKKVSESYVDRHAPHFSWSSVRDKTTNEAGRIYSVGEIKWVNRNKVEIRGGFYAGGLNAMSSLYTLKRSGKGWKVTGMRDVVKS